MNKNSENEPSNQALVSRLEQLEAKVAELSQLIAKMTQKTPASAPAPVAAGGISPQLLAVIAAAIDTVIKVPHLIHSIHEVDSKKSHFNAHDWSVEGRRQIFSSHHIR